MAPATAAATTAAEAISGPEPPELPESSELSPEVAPVGASPASRRAASEVLSGALLDGLAEAWPEACALAPDSWPELCALGAEPCELLDAVAPLLAELVSRPELWPCLLCEPDLELPCEPLPALLFEPLVEPLFELPSDVPEVSLLVAFEVGREVGLAVGFEAAAGFQEGGLFPPERLTYLQARTLPARFLSP